MGLTCHAGTTSQESMGPSAEPDPTTRHSSMNSQSLRGRGILNNLSSMSLFSKPTQKSSRQSNADTETGRVARKNSHAAPEERSVELIGKGKVVASPFDTPSTNTPLTTKGSQNTSIATGTGFLSEILQGSQPLWSYTAL